jgi:hypothetical protein
MAKRAIKVEAVKQIREREREREGNGYKAPGGAGLAPAPPAPKKQQGSSGVGRRGVDGIAGATSTREGNEAERKREERLMQESVTRETLLQLKHKLDKKLQSRRSGAGSEQLQERMERNE